jgi:hypothetical protein
LAKKRTPANGAPTSGTAQHRNGMPAAALPPPGSVMPSRQDRKRITLIVSATLDHNIELFSLATGRMKTEIVVTALSEFLARHNVDPQQDRRSAIRDLLNVSAAGR